MSKVLIFSDLHLNTHKESYQRLQDGIDVLDWIFQTALERGIKDILFLGDFFQHRQQIETLPYQKGYETVQKYMSQNDLNLYLLIGNHDMWYADQLNVSSIYPFNAIRNVRIVNKCETHNIAGLDFDFLPFTLNPLKRMEKFFENRTPSRVLCGHIAINGATLNKLYKTHSEVSVEYDGDMELVDVDKFNGWDKVFLGHYHAEQRLGNIEYVGSPMQINFAEAFEQKHIIIFDTDTFENEYVINEFSPKHYIIKEEDVGNYDLKNSFVKVFASKVDTTNLIDISRDLMGKKEVLSFQVMPTKVKDDVDTREMIDSAKSLFNGKSPVEIFAHYIEKASAPKDLDRKLLIEIVTDIIQKAEIQ